MGKTYVREIEFMEKKNVYTCFIVFEVNNNVNNNNTG